MSVLEAPRRFPPLTEPVVVKESPEIISVSHLSTTSDWMGSWYQRHGAPPQGVTLGPEELIDLVPNLYHFRDYADVANFLRKNTFLAPLLVEAYREIRKYFGPDQVVALEVFRDSEDKDSEELFALIQTELEADEALDRLDRLDEEWWLDASRRAYAQMFISVEFV